MKVRRANAKEKLLDAALSVIRAKGYSATTVDDLCLAGGVTKGAFFHHFKSKEALAVAAAEHWSLVTSEFFRTAPYHDLADPVDRLLGYIDFRKAILQGELDEYTCLVGTMVQETFAAYPPIREACNKSISQHAAVVEADIAEAMQSRGVDAPWTAESLALYTQSVIQGAFILAKAKNNAAIAADCIDHLRRYLAMIFNGSTPKPDQSS